MLKVVNSLKAGDVIKINLSIELKDLPDDIKIIEWDDYAKDYSISYYLDKELLASVGYELEAGYSDSSDDDIEDYIKEHLARDMEEIADYEVFDVDKDDWEYQCAKIRIKSLRND